MVVSISKESLLPEADKTKDLSGMLLLPGLLDAHVHFRDPGLSWKGDFSSESRAAAAGGVTTVCDMPNTDPPTNSHEAFEEKIGRGNRKSYVDFGLHACLPRDSEERSRLKRAGAVSFNTGEIDSEIKDFSILPDFSKLDLLVSAHPEDSSELEKPKPRIEDYNEFIQYRHEPAEVNAISRLLRLGQGGRLHLCHVTTGNSLNLVSGKTNGKVTCEVTPHHLLLSQEDLQNLGPLAKTFPPLRPKKDNAALLEGLREGQIDIIVTDHAPHTWEEKEKGWEESPPGIAGVETSLPLLFTLVKRRKLSLERLVEATSILPAKLFGLRNELGFPKGSMIPGGDADFVVLDHKKEWKIRGNDLHGKTKFTPFEGRKVVGKPVMTIVRGEIMFEDGEIVGNPGYGQFIPRAHEVSGFSTRIS